MLTLAAEAASKHFSRMRVKHLGWLLWSFLEDWCDMTGRPLNGLLERAVCGLHNHRGTSTDGQLSRLVPPSTRNDTNEKRKNQ